MSIFKDQLLTGKTALISGGTSGINMEIATYFARMDAKVVVFGRNAEKSQRAAAEIAEVTGATGRVLGMSCDVRHYDSLVDVVAQTKEKFGPIDIVVAGAAGNFPVTALGMSANAFKTVVEIDLLGTFNLFRASYEHCRRPGASFIAISAEQSINPQPLQSHVCAAKAGINMLVQVLAMEWGPHGVRVNGLMPGPTDGTEGMTRLTPTPESRAALEGAIPLRRYGTKQEVAEVAAFLCSDAAAYITGSIVGCTGGSHLGRVVSENISPTG